MPKRHFAAANFAPLQQDQAPVSKRRHPPNHSYSTSLQEVLAKAIRKKVIHIGKEESKLSLYSDARNVSVENSEELNKKNSQNQQAIITRYRRQGNIQKSIAFLYISKEQLEFEIKNTSFTLTSKKNLRNLTKYILYMRKTTKVTKEIKDLNKQIFHVYKQED